VLPTNIRRLYPVEITIILEWRFWDLQLVDDKVHVTVAFKGEPSRLVIPLRALTYFSDPTEKLNVQLREGKTSEARCKSEDRIASSLHPSHS
jgi:hypothetical protein